MCGRYELHTQPAAIALAFGLAHPPAISARYNIAPMQDVVVVRNEGGVRTLSVVRWGLIPSWAKDPAISSKLINARSETAADKPSFRDALKMRRCIVPASGFYEWDRSDPKKPLPWYVTRSDRAPMVFAALWQDWGQGEERLSTCAILTCAANAQMAKVHDRLPVILDPEDWALWLGEEGKGAARLMEPVPDGALTMVRVGTEINSSRAQGEGLIVPVPLNPA